MRKKLRAILSGALALCLVVNSAVVTRAEETTVDLSNSLIAHYDFEDYTEGTVENKADADTYAATLGEKATIAAVDSHWGSSLDLEGGSLESKMTIHPYSGTPSGSDTASWYDSAMLKAENTGIAHVQSYVNMLPEGKVPVISEYGIFRSTDTQVRSQTHALYIAKVLMEYVRLGSPYIQKHCLTDWYSSGADSLGPTQQAVIQVVAGANPIRNK